jgi:hypothetical protein
MPFRYIIIITITVFGFINAYGQEGFSKVEKGPLIESADPFDHVINATANGIYLYRANKGKIYIDRINSESLKLEASSELTLKVNDKDAHYWRIWVTDAKMYVFATQADKKAKLNNAYYMELDIMTCKPKGDLQKLMGTKTIRDMHGFYDIAVSPDNSKLMLFANPADEEMDLETVFIKVFDNNMTLLWENQFKSMVAGDLAKFNIKMLDNAGNAFIFGTVFQMKAEWSRHGKPNYNYSLYSFMDNGKIFKESRVVLTDKYLTLPVMRTSGKNITLHGFYSIENIEDKEGLYSITLDPVTGYTVKSKYHPFTAEMADSNDKRTIDLRPMYCFETSDRGNVLVGEEYKIKVTYSVDQYGGRTPIYLYTYKDILVYRLNKDQSLKEVHRIQKNDKAVDSDWFASFHAYQQGDDIYFVFNDNTKNYSDSANTRTRYSTIVNETVVSVVKLSNGTVQKEILSADIGFTRTGFIYHNGQLFMGDRVKNGYTFSKAVFK